MSKISRRSLLGYSGTAAAGAEARGWSPITFYGTPPPAPLN
ncbi:hypothetical protein ACIBLA_36875 [Streptomyces sp. NPDC050433]